MSRYRRRFCDDIGARFCDVKISRLTPSSWEQILASKLRRNKRKLYAAFLHQFVPVRTQHVHTHHTYTPRALEGRHAGMGLESCSIHARVEGQEETNTKTHGKMMDKSIHIERKRRCMYTQTRRQATYQTRRSAPNSCPF